MRLKTERNGDKRIKKRFLIFPKTILGETRWWEFAQWEQELIVDRETFWIDNFWID